MTKFEYQITTDSGCDLSLELCKTLNVIPYHMPYTMDGETYRDGMDEDSFRKFYELMRAGGVAKTSQINPEEYTDLWKPMADAGIPVLHIALAGAISGSYSNACLAVTLMQEDYPDWSCVVVDSANASAGFGMIVLRAVSNRDEGMSLQANADYLVANRYNYNAIFTTSDLTYLHRGGRVSRTAAVFGTALNIIPIMHLDYEGHLEVWQKVRGDNQCKSKVIKDVLELVEDAENQTLVISEADAPEKAREYGEALKEACGFRDVFYTHIGPIIGAHTGPGLISIFFVGKQRI